eukprot:g925.t1
MREWFNGGFLPMNLQVKWGKNGVFKVLRDLGPDVFTPGFEKSVTYLGTGDKTMSKSKSVRKRRAVLALESFDDVEAVKIVKVPKSAEQRTKITEALMSNYLFASLDGEAIQMAVDAMTPKVVGSGSYILKQGESGDAFFVMEDGSVKFVVDGKDVGAAKGAATFGELALIYNSPRAADVVATATCKLWSITRLVFRKALCHATTKKHMLHIKMLEEVPSLKDLSTNQINTIAGALKEETFSNGSVIIKQGDIGDKFFIISQGEVAVEVNGKSVAKLKHGQFFGERALIRNEPRDATCIASGTTSCLTLEKKHFVSLLGDLAEIKQISKQREREIGMSGSPKASETRKAFHTGTAKSKVKNHHAYKSLDEFKTLRIIGQGTFGRVKLAQHKASGKVMAMKCLQKQQIFDQKQVDNVLNEKDAMENIVHPFILKLLGTFQDHDQLYFFLEIVHGGELWSLLYQSRALPRVRLGGFEEITARIYAAEVIAGIGHIHECGYMYRDLKPENLMIDKHGYLKIVDFGFCKRIPSGKKSQTLCGTPEYLSPELVLQRGHDHCVDYWAFGCLVYELLTNDTPFADPKQSRIFKKIINSDRITKHMFQRGFPSKAKSLIEQLLVPKPSMRLGMQRNGPKDILSHPWFSGIDWGKLAQKRYKAPYRPKVENELDDRNFDNYDDADTGVQKYRGPQSKFESF